jgi:hypothetical protein
MPNTSPAASARHNQHHDQDLNQQHGQALMFLMPPPRIAAACSRLRSIEPGKYCFINICDMGAAGLAAKTCSKQAPPFLGSSDNAPNQLIRHDS